MAKQRAASRTTSITAENTIADYSNVFFIRKAGIELKVTLQENLVSVQVSSCTETDKPLAGSIAHIQEMILQAELKRYTGRRHIYAYLLTLYSNQGWQIQVLESSVSGEE